MVEFSDVKFEGVAHFREATFQEIVGSAHDTVDFSDASFEKPANFRKAKFITRYPRFTATVFHDNSSFSPEDEFWPPAKQAEPINAKEFCARVRVILAKQGFSEEEHRFFRREMEFSGLIGSWWQRLPYRLFGLLSDYGHSIARPVIGLAILWIIPALIYTMSFAAMLIADDKREVTLDGFGLSFANIFKIFGFQRTYYNIDEIQALHGALQVMGAAQTVFGFVLLFFLGLGLRTRFRMR